MKKKSSEKSSKSAEHKNAKDTSLNKKSGKILAIVIVEVVTLLLLSLYVLFGGAGEPKKAVDSKPLKVSKKAEPAEDSKEKDELVDYKTFKESQPEPEEVVVETPVKEAEVEEKKPAAVKKAKKEVKKVKKVVKKTKKPAKKIVSRTAKKGFYLQIGAYTVKANYDEEMEKLKAFGYDTDMKMLKKKLTEVRVMLGRFGSKKSAEDMVSEARKVKQKATIIESDGKYEVSVNAYFNKAKAAEIKTALAQAGIKSRVRSEEKLFPFYTLRAGPFNSEAKAKAVQEELSEKGYKKTYLLDK